MILDQQGTRCFTLKLALMLVAIGIRNLDQYIHKVALHLVTLLPSSIGHVA